MLSEDDKRFFALYLKQCQHRAKFPSPQTKDVEAKYERQFEVKNRLMRETKDLVKKWEKTGLLDGLKSDTKKTDMAVLIESEPKKIVTSD